ncbi:NIPSNAP family protein [Aliamphritea spongicola]|nr:NIPSNAP family protein [Aliamphritea spongicola]
MVTCHIRYEIDPAKVQAFETYARMWLPLVTKFGGQHHGYFLPHEGKNYEAFAAFSFESMAAYEEYREKWQRTKPVRQPLPMHRKPTALSVLNGSLCARC